MFARAAFIHFSRTYDLIKLVLVSKKNYNNNNYQK